MNKKAPQQEDVMDVRSAEAREYPMTIGLAGPGGSGKTYTALMLATAFAQGGKVAMIDTEDGRGERYFKHFDYEYGQLEPPFSPDRYIAAMDQMIRLGAKAIVIDSASHEWEGLGGCLEIHEQVTNGDARRNMVGWAKVKPMHRRFIEHGKRTGVHMVFCFRAREKSKPNPDKNARPDEKIINIGWRPISNDEAQFEFVLTAMLEPGGEGKLMDAKTFIDFRDSWKPGLKITPKIAERLVTAHRKSCMGDEKPKPKPVETTKKPDPEPCQPDDPFADLDDAPPDEIEVWINADTSVWAGTKEEAAKALASEIKSNPDVAFDALTGRNPWIFDLNEKWGERLLGLIDQTKQAA